MTELHPAPFGEGNGTYFMLYIPKGDFSLICSLPPHIDTEGGFTAAHVHGRAIHTNCTQVLADGDKVLVNGDVYIIRHAARQGPAGVSHHTYIERVKS